jgi:hypothetical protein
VLAFLIGVLVLWLAWRSLSRECRALAGVPIIVLVVERAPTASAAKVIEGERAS